MRKRLALGISIPAVILFIGILIALLMPSNFFVLTEALAGLGLLGGRHRIAGLVSVPPGAAPAPPLLILNGTLWDADSGIRPNLGLPISQGRIAERPVEGATVIDAAGLTILPGLIDMHIHLFGGTFAGEMFIGNGVTTARDLGTHLAGALSHRQESDRGARIGPRLFVTGPYLVGVEGTMDQQIGARGPAEAAEIVSRFADAGVDGIKVHSGIPAETLVAAVEAAHRRGLWVAAHLDLVGAVQAAGLGVDTIEHAAGIAGEEPDLAAEDAAIAAMVAHDVALTPTLVVAEHAFTLPSLARGESPALAFVPRLLRRFWISSQIANASAENLSSAEVARRRGHLERMKRLVGRFRRAGGRVLAGTDAPAFLVAPGFDIHRELELLVESGLSPAEALAAATREAAQELGHGSELGGLAPGMRGDLVLVAGDPLDPGDGISATRRIVLVVKDGHVMRRVAGG